MRLSILVGAAGTCLVTGSVLAQTPASAPQLRAVTRTIYTRNTELFAEWQPLVAGQPARLTAHLTHTGDRFRPYTEGTATLTLIVEGETANARADAPERPGVFRLNVTPTKAGTGRVVIDVTAAAGRQHFVMDGVPVYPDTRAALANEAPEEEGLISFAKERSWAQDFATAPPTVYFPGAGNILTVPASALLHDGDKTLVYVQRTPERFELRQVKTRRTFGTAIEIVNGLKESERVVVLGADKMPRPQ
jgi:hypothetical protein